LSVLANIENQKEVIYLARLFPSKREVAFSASDIGPTTVVADLNANFVTGLSFNGDSFSEHTSLDGFSVSTADRYFFDVNAQKLYLDYFGRTQNWTTTDVVQVDYEICLGSKEIAHLRDPLNSASESTIYRPNLQPNFALNKTVENQQDGFMPAITSSLTLTNVDYDLSTMFGRSTLSKKRAVVYILSGELSPQNTYFIFDGICTGANFSDESIQISVADSIFNFEGKFSYGDSRAILNFSDYTRLQLDKNKTFVPVVYGVVPLLECSNITYYEDSAPFSVGNTQYIAAKHYGNTTDDVLQYEIISVTGPTSYELNTVRGLNIGDEIYKSNTVASASNSVRIRDIDRGTNNIIVGSTPESPGTFFYRDRIAYAAMLNKETGQYTTLNRLDGSNFSFNVSYDTTNKLILVDTPWNSAIQTAVGTDQPVLVVRIYGEKNTFGITGETFNSLSRFGVNSKWHQVIYQYLREQVGFSENEINLNSFLGFESNLDGQYDVGFYLPKDRQNLPSHREVISKILKSNFASLFLNEDQKIDLIQREKMDQVMSHLNLMNF
jgi:hypothetical protein